MDNDKIIERKKNQYFIFFVLTIFILYTLFNVFFEVGRVAGDSMYPSLLDKDIELSIKAKFKDINRGDIVNINSSYLNESLVKRVIALEGDIIEIKENGIYINGEYLEEPYIYNSKNAPYDIGFYMVVPKGYVFVLGDNRHNSKDSRDIGCINKKEIRSILLLHIR